MFVSTSHEKHIFPKHAAIPGKESQIAFVQGLGAAKKASEAGILVIFGVEILFPALQILPS